MTHRGMQMRICIVDDHGLFRAGLEHLLRTLDPTIIVDSLAGIDDLNNLNTNTAEVDMVLLDYHLPGLSGPQSMAAVRLELPASKIVVVSAETNPQKILTMIEQGACGFIPKAA